MAASYKESKYKVFVIVTNMDRDGNELIRPACASHADRWFYECCGKGEEAHGVMKEDLAGGKLPSKDLGENAAGWWIMVLALNLNAAMKQLVLGKSWAAKRVKAIRFAFAFSGGCEFSSRHSRGEQQKTFTNKTNSPKYG